MSRVRKWRRGARGRRRGPRGRAAVRSARAAVRSALLCFALLINSDPRTGHQAILRRGVDSLTRAGFAPYRPHKLRCEGEGHDGSRGCGGVRGGYGVWVGWMCV